MKRITMGILCLLMAVGMVFGGANTQASGSGSAAGPAEFTATFIKGVYHGDPNDMILYKNLEKETNVKVTWLVIPATNWNERKNILINSGDMPDIFYMNTYSADEIDRYGRQGLFLDLTPLIKQHGPWIQKMLDDYPITKPIVLNPSDGKIYRIKGFHYRTEMTGALAGTMFIYQPWLDKLGLKMPTTYLEFENMLRAFKTRDPNGNGRADEYPFVFANGWSGNSSLQQFFAMFGYGYEGIRPTGSTFVETEDHKAVFVPGTENFKEAIIWLHKLFSEGLLAEEDYAAMDRNLFSAKNFSETVVTGSFSAFHKNSAYVPAERFNDYTRIDIPMKGPRGHQIYMGRAKDPGSTAGAIVTNKAKDIPAVMRWLDAHYEPTWSLEMSLGPIGINLERKPGGILGYIPTPPDTNYNQFRYGNCPSDNAPFLIPPEAWGKTIEIMEEDIDRIPWGQGVLKPYLTQNFIYSYPVEAETRFIQSRGKEIDDYVKTTQAKWLMDGGIEREWDTFQARLKTMGVDEYTRIMQSQIDRFIKAMQ
jgi:putative aldouronate transport system substrate-binding protein